MTSSGNNFNHFPENRTSLMLHFLPYAKIFQSRKGGHGPKWPNGKYAYANIPNNQRRVADAEGLRKSACVRF